MSPAVLYLHGLASSPLSHKALFFQQRLADRGIPMVLPDLNEGDFHGLTTSRAVALATRLGRDLTAPILLFGSSFGGRVAVHTAAALADRVAGLVLMAPALRFASVWRNTQSRESLARWRETGALPVEHPAYEGPVTLGYAFYEDALATDAWPPLPPTLPVLILHGRRDDVVPLADSERFAAHHPGARLVPLDSDHGLTDQTDRLWAEVEPFLAHLTPSPGGAAPSAAHGPVV